MSEPGIRDTEIRDIEIRNYRVRIGPSFIHIDQYRTLKDWFDSFLLTGLGCGAFVVVLKVVERQLERIDPIEIIVGAIFAFVGSLLVADGTSRMFWPVRRVVSADRDQGVLEIRYPFRRVRLPHRRIKRIELQGRIERYRIGGRRTRTSSVRILVVDKNGQAHPALLVNTDRFLRIVDDQLNDEVHRIARKIAEPLAEFLDKPCRWTGFDDRSHSA